MTASSPGGPPWSFAEGPPEPGGLRVRAWPFDPNRSMLAALRVKGVWEAILSQSLMRAQRLKTRNPLCGPQRCGRAPIEARPAMSGAANAAEPLTVCGRAMASHKAQKRRETAVGASGM